ncbi:type II toxin-antitoxin system HicB family antitoxin [Vibrio owensii]|uniref:type II toxin-antitoxin system HicB family antitoxin n=1 Tax=Vibrio owensii TaxID=696485 RepID=UPI003394A09F
MRFTVGIEIPMSCKEAFGLVVPVLCTKQYRCYGAADEREEIEVQAEEAIKSILELMVANKEPLDELEDQGAIKYATNDDYKLFTQWIDVDVDIEEYLETLEDHYLANIAEQLKDEPTKLVDLDDF